MKRLVAVLAAVALGTCPALAKVKIAFERSEPVILEPGKAYIAVWQDTPSPKQRYSLVLVRLLDKQELERARGIAGKRQDRQVVSNVVVSVGDVIYATDRDKNLFLFEAPPGRYVLAGLAYVNRHNGPIFTCLCMGTVSFAAEPGKVTNMGTLVVARDDLPTAVPELAGLVRGYSIGVEPWPVVAALRPPETSLPLPAAMASLPIVAVNYYAYDKFPNVIGGSVERLAPLAGVLTYDRDRVVDLRASGSARR